MGYKGIAWGTVAVITLGTVAGLSGRAKNAKQCYPTESIPAAKAVAEQENYSPNSVKVGVNEPKHIVVPDFSYPNEMGVIEECADRVGVDLALMLAIRDSEDGGDDLQFGVQHTKRYISDGFLTEPGGSQRPYSSNLEKQAHWCALSIRNSILRWNSLSREERYEYSDFIDFMGDSYAREGADNDTDKLNINWKPNVRSNYLKFKAELEKLDL